MTTAPEKRARPPAPAAGFGRVLALATALFVTASLPVLAQGFNWPWDEPSRKPPPQEAPAWRPPPEPAPPPAVQPAPAARSDNPICLQLEQRLVQEGQRGNQSRDLVPMVESELRQVEQQYRTSSAQLDKSNCYDYFLFSKTLRRSPKCVDLSREVEQLKRRVSDLETQRQQMQASGGHSYQDDIIRELARNNCGPAYTQQARRSDGPNPFSSLWQDEESSGSGGVGTFGNLGYATYRTVCVRLCDGYYFPVSFSTLPNHFERDAEVCQSKCAAPTELFYYQNPGGAVDQMVGFRNNEQYTTLKSAFRYRKEYVQGCSCKEVEYTPQTPIPQQTGSVGAPPSATTPRPRAPAQSISVAPPPRAEAPAGDASGWVSETAPALPQ